MDKTEYSIFNVTHLPAVCCPPANAFPGYGSRWQEEIEALIARGEAFYMIFPPGERREDRADTLLRTAWLKANKTRLGAVCRSVVRIEEDRGKRAKLIAQAGSLEKAFAIPRLFVGSMNEALLVGTTSLYLERNA